MMLMVNLWGVGFAALYLLGDLAWWQGTEADLVKVRVGSGL